MKTQHSLFGLLLAAFCVLNTSCTSYYYMVRHAEKVSSDDNTSLTTAGHQRARVLCDSLRNKNVTRIFTSDAIRTQQTAQPTVGLLNITPTTYNRNQGVVNLEAQLRALSDPNVLVVGHSDNIPALILALTGTSVTTTADGFIPENDFDNFYIIKRERGLGSDRFSVFRIGTYGAPSP